jgi:hypothetical protein
MYVENEKDTLFVRARCAREKVQNNDNILPADRTRIQKIKTNFKQIIIKNRSNTRRTL